jgi:hypothetical protein
MAENVRFHIGGDLDRLENRQEPEGLTYVLDCFTKTTNQTAQSDILIARDGLKALQEAISDRPREARHGKAKKHR